MEFVYYGQISGIFFESGNKTSGQAYTNRMSGYERKATYSLREHELIANSESLKQKERQSQADPNMIEYLNRLHIHAPLTPLPIFAVRFRSFLERNPSPPCPLTFTDPIG